MILASEFPVPPSANSMYRAYKNRLIKSAPYREWIATAKPIALAATTRGFTGMYVGFGSARVRAMVEFYPASNRMQDLDNRLKALFDLIEEANWINNDSQIDEIFIFRRSVDKHDPRIKLTMEKMIDGTK